MSKPLTGKKVLCIALGAFGTIIAANMTLAIAAVSSFPGIEVKNGYVASQYFEAERVAQEQLGWTAVARHDGAGLVIELRDAAGAPLQLDALTAKVGRPTGRAVDRSAELRPLGKAYEIPGDLEEGLWRVDLLAERGADRFRQHLTIQVKPTVAR